MKLLCTSDVLALDGLRLRLGTFEISNLLSVACLIAKQLTENLVASKSHAMGVLL